MPNQSKTQRPKPTAKSVQSTVKANESRGGNADTQWYRQKRWFSLRDRVRKEEPFCRECGKLGRQVLTTEIDHIKPVRLGGEKYDRTNVQGLCTPCHSRKSALERNQ